MQSIAISQVEIRACFSTGDEHFYDVLTKDVVKQHIGDDLGEDLPASTIFARLQEKFDVFMLYPFKEEALRQRDIQQELKTPSA